MDQREFRLPDSRDMSTDLFRRFCEIAYSRAGITLKDGKEALVSARIAKRLRVLGLPDERSYLHVLEADDTGEELIYFLDVISTNHTSFYREPEHFEVLASSVRTWLDEGQHKIRLWCAASSSGEEPYTISMTVLDVIGARNVDFLLLATDISTRVLEKARLGQYDDRVVQPIVRERLSKYFERKLVGEDTIWEAKAILKAPVTFKRLNLSTPPFPMKGPLDAILCRNVMIYFDHPVRQRLILEMERLLKPGGLLFIGHAETLTGISCGLTKLSPSVYCK
jgi:chemotaxis protein methyltransferase CheR